LFSKKATVNKISDRKKITNKNRNLILGIIFDLVGMLSFVIPFIGEISDVFWAPIATYLMSRMYKGKIGKSGIIFTFFEEILPFTDVVPTFTIIWIYNYYVKKEE
jgi:hypothetical protein